MTQKKHILYLLLLLTGSSIFTYGQPPTLHYNQQENFLKANSHWFFAGHYQAQTNSDGVAIVNFNTSPPTTLVDSTFIGGPFTGGTAAVSDTGTGAFLFCTNGDYCLNKNLDTMPNGISLAGDTIVSTGSVGARPTARTDQAACIVPVIGDPDRFYVFSLQSEMPIPHLYYSVVDMTLDGGLGDVDTTQKMILVSDSTVPLGRSMMAVPGNNCDIWLVVHSALDTTFFAYHITEAGIDLTPVISSPGGISSGLDVTFEAGVMAISPDRSKLAISSYFPGCEPANLLVSGGGIIVADFDATTGQVSNGIMADSSIAAFSLSFSPDGTKLYASGADTLAAQFSGSNPYLPKEQICQYDISNYTPSAIINSKVVLLEDDTTNIKIHLRARGDTILVSRNKSTPKYSLEYIASPNLPGLSCDYRTDQGYIADTVFTGASFGTDVVYPVVDIQRQMVLDTIACNALTLEAPSLNTNYLWDDGTTDSIREVTTSGQYWVAYNDGCHFGVDTFVVDVIDLNPVITVNGFVLGTTMTYDTYQWLLNGSLIAGATQSTLTVSENGDYQVIVSGELCTDTSEIYEVTNAGVGITETSIREDIKIYPNPGKDIVFVKAPINVTLSILSVEGKILSECKNATRVNIGSLAEGVYLIKIFNEAGVLLKVEKFVKSNGN